jgi:hypothetical protein
MTMPAVEGGVDPSGRPAPADGPARAVEAGPVPKSS